MKLIKTLALAAIFATLSVSAFAQRGQGGGWNRGNQGSPAVLLGRADVQGDLKLTSDQKAKLDAMREEMTASMRERFSNGGERPSRQEMQKIFAEMEKSTNEKLATILTPEQVTRLKQISVQIAGSSAVFRADIAKELAISDAQKTKLDELQAGMRKANGAIRQKMQDGELDREAAQASMKKNSDVLNLEVDKILTAEQKDKLKAMAGAPFTRRDDQR